MTYLNSLEQSIKPIVLDTSVLINIFVSGSGEQIIRAVPNEILVPTQVYDEFSRGKCFDDCGGKFIQNVMTRNHFSFLSLSDNENTFFEKLTCNGNTIGDGEAAVIAISASRGYVPVIDDKKGRKFANKYVSERIPGYSLDIFRHTKVVECLGNEQAIHALFQALSKGKMHIDKKHLGYVINIIGEDNIKFCPSIPKSVMQKSKSHELDVNKLISGYENKKK